MVNHKRRKKQNQKEEDDFKENYVDYYSNIRATMLSRGVRTRELFRRKDFSKKSKVMSFYFGVRALK
jgi:hypothetical protein